MRGVVFFAGVTLVVIAVLGALAWAVERAITKGLDGVAR